MAYTPATLSLLQGLIQGGYNLWLYTTTDAIGTVTGGSYFTDAADKGLGLGDIVWVIKTSTPSLYVCQVSSVTTTAATVVDTATVSVSLASVDAIAGSDASLGIDGLAAAQGGAIVVTGGTSATAANAGGAVSVVGGTPGATGVGGAVNLIGGAAVAGTGGEAKVTGGAGGGAGVGGAATIAAGIGGATNAAGGVASLTGGAGQGTGAGGVSKIVGGASGGGATGDGGDAQVTGGAAASSAGNGGAVILTGGAKTGTGRVGSVIARGQNLAQSQVTPTAKTVTAAITAAELATGIITTTGVTAPSVHQLPTGTLLLAEFPDFAANDSFDFFLINTGVGASDDATITVNTDVTIVGSPTVGALTDATIITGSGHFRARYTTGVTWIVYRLA